MFARDDQQRDQLHGYMMRRSAAAAATAFSRLMIDLEAAPL